MTNLRNKAARCEFGDLKDGLIHDRIVCGINDDTVRARLLREAELTLEGCLDICRAAEISSAQLKVLNEEKTVHVVRDDALNRGDSQKDERGNAKDSKAGMIPCQFCGYRHKRGHCPAHGKTCNACHKPITILQVYARLTKKRFMQWTKKVPVTNSPSSLVL